MSELTMDKLVALAKNRGFVFPGSEIYGGLANSWDYGPLGSELKKNIKEQLLLFWIRTTVLQSQLRQQINLITKILKVLQTSWWTR